MKRAYWIWLLRIIPAIVMVQTLYFKFTTAPESVYIFSTLGMEPVGRIGTGCLELVASVLLLIPRTSPLGALLGVGLMAGAILSHLTKLGIEVMGDGGYLFFLAIVVFICCVALVLLWRRGVIRSSWSTLDEMVGGRGRSREAISKK